MTSLTVTIDEAVLSETESLSNQLQIRMDEYVNQAVTLLNKVQKRKMLGEQLEIESKLVQAESMKVLAEFEKLDDKSTTI